RKLRYVGGVRIHFVAIGGLCRATVAAAVVRDNPVTLRQKVHHLRVPVVGRQGPAMMKHDRLSVAPVLVEDLYAVFGGECVHALFSLTVSGLFPGDYPR